MFHYLAWPDHGVPANAISMLNFVKKVRKTHPYHKQDLVLVHCSAGVGRTGTFITLDYMLERIKHEQSINVYEYVSGLRQQRVLMVQSLVRILLQHELASIPKFFLYQPLVPSGSSYMFWCPSRIILPLTAVPEAITKLSICH